MSEFEEPVPISTEMGEAFEEMRGAVQKYDAYRATTQPTTTQRAELDAQIEAARIAIQAYIDAQ
jgi:hypothetical protein